MTYNNFSNENNQPDKLSKIPVSIYFDNVFEKLPKRNWWHKDTKLR